MTPGSLIVFRRQCMVTWPRDGSREPGAPLASKIVLPYTLAILVELSSHGSTILIDDVYLWWLSSHILFRCAEVL